MELDEFRKGLLEDTLSRAAAGSAFTEQAFFEHTTDLLIDAEEVPGADGCHYRGRGPRGKALRVDGYSFLDSEGLICLFITDFRGGTETETLTQTAIEEAFGKLEAFMEAAVAGRLAEEEESSPGYGLATDLAARAKDFSKLRLYLLSDAQLSSRVKGYDHGTVAGLPCTYQIWDVTRFHRVAESQLGREEIVIDFVEMFSKGIPCLPAHVSDGDYEGYLCVMPGTALAEIYDRYGDRLLEQNVRTFLQERGSVNKGIRVTLTNEPSMFFAYNNGITATAAAIELREDKNGHMEVVRARDLQIVNGGQTTASVFWAGKKHKADLAKVFVQMKLSVIALERSNAVVPKISEYANSQNKVNAADFFANHPFHMRMEEFSRRIWAPATGGSQFNTHWFYERARGQYLNAQASLTDARKKQFQTQSPRAQMLTKTDLAKVQNSWSRLPHVVSQGAQKNFARYAKTISEEWERDPTQFSEAYFKMAIVQAILFRSAEKIVSQQSWYDGGYRANIVTYSVAYLAHAIAGIGKRLDSKSIWQAQAISPAMTQQLAIIAKAVVDVLIAPPEGKRNVTEWAKMEACWTRVRELDVELRSGFVQELVDRQVTQAENRDAADVQAIDDGINAQAEVFKLGSPYWQAMLTWGQTTAALSPTEGQFIQSALNMPRRLPSDKQCRRLLEIRKKAEREGFRPS
jgi:hypothetical protein